MRRLGVQVPSPAPPASPWPRPDGSAGGEIGVGLNHPVRCRKGTATGWRPGSGVVTSIPLAGSVSACNGEPRLRVSTRLHAGSDPVGEVPEWPKGADCKSVALRFGGSNPPLPTTTLFDDGVTLKSLKKRNGIVQVSRVAIVSLQRSGEVKIPRSRWNGIQDVDVRKRIRMMCDLDGIRRE